MLSIRGVVKFSAFLSLCAMAIAACHAAERTKLAEGEYGVTRAREASNRVGKTIDDWIVWQLPTGQLQVEIKLPKWGRPAMRQRGIATIQTFTFTTKLELVGYEVHLVRGDERADLFCKLKPKLLSCREAKTARAAVQVDTVPYSFMPGEFYGLDLAWFYASLIHNETKPAFETPVYMLDLPDVDSKMRIVPDERQTVKYLGKEQITVMNKKVDANKYELPKMKSVVWTAADSGMVLAMESRDRDADSKMTDDSAGRVELTRFRSYDPTFSAELK